MEIRDGPAAVIERYDDRLFLLAIAAFSGIWSSGEKAERFAARQSEDLPDARGLQSPRGTDAVEVLLVVARQNSGLISGGWLAVAVY